MSFYDEEEIDNYYRVESEIAKEIEGKKLSPIELDKIKLGDKVCIKFYPASQKYI